MARRAFQSTYRCHTPFPLSATQHIPIEINVVYWFSLRWNILFCYLIKDSNDCYLSHRTHCKDVQATGEMSTMPCLPYWLRVINSNVSSLSLSMASLRRHQSDHHRCFSFVFFSLSKLALVGMLKQFTMRFCLVARWGFWRVVFLAGDKPMVTSPSAGGIGNCGKSSQVKS